MMIPTSYLAGVKGATNSILVGNKGGNTSITGRGAGGPPPASRCFLTSSRSRVRSRQEGASHSTPFGYENWHPSRIARPKMSSATYLRLVVHNRPGILGRVCTILGRHHIDVDPVLQEPECKKQHLPFP